MKVKNKNGWFFRFVWFVFVIFFSIILSKYMLGNVNDMLAMNKPEESVIVEIPENSKAGDIAKILHEKGVIDKKNFFRLYVNLTNSSKKFSAGVYNLKTNMDYEAIISHMKNKKNSKEVVEITFTEGMNILDYAELLDDNGICKKESFLESCNSDEFDAKFEFLKNIDKTKVYCKLEGFLYPDTYQFYKGESANDSIKRFLHNFEKKVVKDSSVQEMFKNSSFSLQEIIVIASLVQAESANKDDMFNVSSVIQNRLKTLSNNGYNVFGEGDLATLRIDSTVWYPYKTRQNVPKKSASSFKAYNTYEIKGLPPGSICSPSTEAITAALKPNSTNYYYFCHSKTGEAFYAKTNNAHIANLHKAGLV